jgi:hypothetical protein
VNYLFTSHLGRLSGMRTGARLCRRPRDGGAEGRPAGRGGRARALPPPARSVTTRIGRAHSADVPGPYRYTVGGRGRRGKSITTGLKPTASNVRWCFALTGRAAGLPLNLIRPRLPRQPHRHTRWLADLRCRVGVNRPERGTTNRLLRPLHSLMIVHDMIKQFYKAFYIFIDLLIAIAYTRAHL